MNLSPKQEEAASHREGHLRIIACPGSGKTETVSTRIARMIRDGADPAGIVAFTFTVKAAGELKARIRRILEAECPERPDLGGMYVGTVDSFCLYMLKRIRPEYGNFEVLAEAKRNALLTRWYLDIGLHRIQGTEYMSRTINSFCRSVDILLMERVDMSKITNRNFVSCYERYVEVMRDNGYFDFASVIDTFLSVLEQDGPALEQVNGEVKHVVFDEYQDVNGIQERMLKLISRGAESVCVVGDDDQNIFQWRGSSVEYIKKFPSGLEDLPSTRITLDVNYRATDELVGAANRLIGNNEKRLEKNMRPSEGQHNRFERGDMFIRHFDTHVQESKFICDTMKDLHGTGFAGRDGATYPLSYGDMAVIVHTNKEASIIMKALDECNIAYAAYSGTGVFEVPLVRLALNCLMYVFGHPGYDTNGTLDPGDLKAGYAALELGDPGRFMEDLEVVRGLAGRIKPGEALPNLGLQEFYHRILAAMGAERGEIGDGDLSYLAALGGVISDYEHVWWPMGPGDVALLKSLIDSLKSRNSDHLHGAPARPDAVRIMTIWKAKGLEFPAVFLPLFNSKQKPKDDTIYVDPELYPAERYEGGDEARRRAAYTAVTRAQKHLFITGSKLNDADGKRARKPHPFLEEITGPEFVSTRVPRGVKVDGKRPADPAGTIPASYSSLSVYGECPYKYKLQHVMGFGAGVPEGFDYGLNMHGILALIHTGYMRDGRIPDAGSIPGIFDRMFRPRFAPADVAGQMRGRGIESVKSYVGSFGSYFGRIAWVEKRFELGIGRADVSGFMDLVLDAGDGRVEIIDFKTGPLGARSGHSKEYAGQVAFYAHAARASLGRKPLRGVLHHLDTGEIEEVDVGYDAARSARDLLAGRIDGISGGTFDPDPEESKCRGCGFRAVCSHKGFVVGASFEPLESVRRDGRPGMVGAGGDLLPSIVSNYVKDGAKKLAGRVGEHGGAYRIESRSEPGTFHVVDASGCDCAGFLEYPGRYPGRIPTCAHVEAVKLFTSGRYQVGGGPAG
ncbi:MAG: ATP-dependent helicase [Nitrosopumilus sp.]|nr:ATP-dependent helicase [Nitrosopumilus sp.]